MTMSSAFYESDEAIAQYLLFHYGTPEQVCPLLSDARGACGFAERSVSEPLRYIELRRRGRALDLGCAVGRATMELGRHFEEVLGIDFSARFVAEAQRIQRDRRIKIRVPREGAATDEFRLELPDHLGGENVHFRRGDACDLPADLEPFDLVLMANLIDRMPDPARCLAQLPALVNSGGWLIITSPYTWLDEYTPRDKWLFEDGSTLNALASHLAPDFISRKVFDLPFLIREHRRKYQWSIAEVSLWQRK